MQKRTDIRVVSGLVLLTALVIISILLIPNNRCKDIVVQLQCQVSTQKAKEVNTEILKNISDSYQFNDMDQSIQEVVQLLADKNAGKINVDSSYESGTFNNLYLCIQTQTYDIWMSEYGKTAPMIILHTEK